MTVGTVAIRRRAVIGTQMCLSAPGIGAVPVIGTYMNGIQETFLRQRSTQTLFTALRRVVNTHRRVVRGCISVCRSRRITTLRSSPRLLQNSKYTTSLARAADHLLLLLLRVEVTTALATDRTCA
jgi:hypothetical protein